MKIGGGLGGALGGGKSGGADMPGPDLSGKGRQDIGPNGARNNGSDSNGGGIMGNALNFGSSALSKVTSPSDSVQFGNQNKTSGSDMLSNKSQSGEGASGSQNSVLNSLTQLLSAIVQLLKGQSAEGSEKGGKEGANASGNGNATQDASGKGDMMTQLMEMIKKMLGISDDGKSTGDAATKQSAGGNGSAGGAQDASGGDMMTQLMEMIKKMLGISDGGKSTGQSAEGGTGAGGANASPSQGTAKEGTQESGGLAGKLGSALQMLGLGAILSALQGGGAASAQGGSEGSK